LADAAVAFEELRARLDLPEVVEERGRHPTGF
jgi:hypothetical protein